MEAFAYEPLETRELVHAHSAADDARSRGYEEGYRTGLADAKAQLIPAAEALAEALEGTSTVAQELADASETRAVELAVMIAEKIVATSLEIRPELILDVVSGALRRVSTPERVTLEVSPDDLELVRGSIEQFADRLAGVERLEVLGERRIPRGGCVLRTAEGEIDGQVSEQLARAAELLRDDLSTRDTASDD